MLSTRGQKYREIGYQHGLLDEYNEETNPNGIVDLSSAENFLIHGEVIQFINSHKLDASCCGYGEGYTGTLRLRKAMALHMNEYCNPFEPLTAEHITFAAGVTDLNEVCALLTCDADCGDAILLGKPNYGSFARDMVSRGHISQVFADFGGADQFSSDCVPYYLKAYDAAKEEGINIKALVICNPHNPLGQCYSREALIELMKFCQSKQIHLISDEIYALSTYQRTDRPSEKYVSVFAIDSRQFVDPNLIHVLYGLSKDYGAAGLRLGCLITRNAEFSDAARSLCRFSSPSQISMSLAAALLEDRIFLKSLLESSHSALYKSRKVAEVALEQVGIKYHREGNAGLFLWLDLRPYLPTTVTNGDEWAAEKLLWNRFENIGVQVSLGKRYFAPNPGHFRMVFSNHESVVLEGIRRIKTVCNRSKNKSDWPCQSLS
ncbi:PLP-dependent transferase [Mollisia scopiformis]|uniref:PLP-dependent transferase n=1 Tax=Mollisia scopiformis TaxID=149040 RepID=A0A132BD81_MOLSC|nr:PLP-dependent transferase [Mollisia scopiformis]KUJ10213.1 PLP-dependent transferase [Mollisia scopiformis]